MGAYILGKRTGLGVAILTFALLSVVPDIEVGLRQDGERFVATSPSAQVLDESLYYAPLALRFAIFGDIPFEADVFEYRDSLTPVHRLSAVAVGALARLTGLPFAWSLARGVGCALSLLLAFLIAARHCGSLAALASALVFCTFGQGLRNMFMLGWLNALEPMVLSRMLPQALATPLFLAALWGLQEVLLGNAVLGAVVAAMAGGLLFSSYIYFAAVFAVTICFLIAISFARGDASTRKALLVVGIGVNVVAIPWYYSLVVWLTNHTYRMFSAAPGVEDARPGTGAVAVMVACLLFAGLATSVHARAAQSRPGEESASTLGPSRSERLVGASHWLTPFAQSFFVPVLAAALLELVVAREIVGIPQATHFYQRVAVPLTSIAATIAMFAYLAARIPRWARTASLAAILSIFALAAVKQVRSAHALAAWRVAQQADRDVDALLGAVPTPDVVGIWDLRTNAVSAARVARWRFFAYRWRSQVPPQEDRRRYVFLSKLTGKGWDEVNAELSHPLDDFVRRVELEGSDAKERAALKVFYATADRSFLLERRLDWLVLPGTSVPDAIRRASEMGLTLRQMRRRGDHALMKVAIDHGGAKSP